MYAEEPCDNLFGCSGGNPFNIVLSVGEDGGQTFDRVGVVAQSHLVQSLDATFDLHVREDGGRISLVAHSSDHDATVFQRYERE